MVERYRGAIVAPCAGERAGIDVPATRGGRAQARACPAPRGAKVAGGCYQATRCVELEGRGAGTLAEYPAAAWDRRSPRQWPLTVEFHGDDDRLLMAASCPIATVAERP